MKKTVMIIMCAILIYSCDKGGTVINKIDNRTDNKGIVNFYYNDIIDIYTFEAHSKIDIGRVSALGITGFYFMKAADSVIFQFENADYINYYIDSVDNGKKNIFNETYWEVETTTCKTCYEGTFPINEEDLQTHY